MQGQMERTGAAARPWDPVRGSRRTLAALVSAVWICLLAATPLMAALAPQGTVDALARQIEALYSRAPDLEETFDQGADDWYDDGDIYRYDATGGNFRLRIRKPNSLHWIRYDKSTELALADYLVEVVALPVPLRSSGSYGLIFRFQDDNNYYLFALSGRYYSLQAYVQGQWSFLVDWTESPAIEARWDMPNRLGVLARGSQIVLLINDQIVAVVADDAIPTGGVGLAAYTFESGVMEVTFDDLAIWQLSQTAQPAVPDADVPDEEVAGEEAPDEAAPNAEVGDAGASNEESSNGDVSDAVVSDEDTSDEAVPDEEVADAGDPAAAGADPVDSRGGDAVSWSILADGPFALRYPQGWSVRQGEDGRVEVTGVGSEQVVIWPLYVARAVDTPQALAILQALAQAQRPDLRWGRGSVVSAGLVRQVGRSGTQTGVAGLAWVSDGAQSALFFYLVAAPTARFEAQVPLFATILRSFQVQSTGQEPAPMPARLDFVPFTDPMEGAFHGEVPAGWETEGGLYRAAAVDVRPWLRTRSPDQAILVFAGEPQVPTFSLPSEISSWLGWQEGDWYSPGYGVQMMISRYLPGEEFAAAYVTRWMDLPGCVIQEKVPLTQLEETLNQLLIQNGLLLPGQRQDMGYVTFTCPSEGQPVTGFLLVQTTLLEMYGTGIWQVTVLTGFLASPERVGEASAVMAHLTSTWRTDPRWYAAQQQTTAAVSAIVTTTSQEIAAIVNQVYEQAQRVQDRLAEDYARALRGVEDVQDPRTGEVYQVQSSSNYYWIDPRGNIVGTNVYFNPDGLRFEEMLRLP